MFLVYLRVSSAIRFKKIFDPDADSYRIFLEGWDHEDFDEFDGGFFFGGQAIAVEGPCEGKAGEAYGLNTAYCVAMNCDANLPVEEAKMKKYTRRALLKRSLQGLLLTAAAGLNKVSTAAHADTVTYAENQRSWPGRINRGGKKPLVIIHDGAIDEFMAISLAVSLPDYELKTIIVMNADCIGYTTGNRCQSLNCELMFDN